MRLDMHAASPPKASYRMIFAVRASRDLGELVTMRKISVPRLNIPHILSHLAHIARKPIPLPIQFSILRQSLLEYVSERSVGVASTASYQ